MCVCSKQNIFRQFSYIVWDWMRGISRWSSTILLILKNVCSYIFAIYLQHCCRLLFIYFSFYFLFFLLSAHLIKKNPLHFRSQLRFLLFVCKNCSNVQQQRSIRFSTIWFDWSLYFDVRKKTVSTMKSSCTAKIATTMDTIYYYYYCGKYNSVCVCVCWHIWHL